MKNTYESEGKGEDVEEDRRKHNEENFETERGMVRMSDKGRTEEGAVCAVPMSSVFFLLLINEIKTTVATITSKWGTLFNGE